MTWLNFHIYGYESESELLLVTRQNDNHSAGYPGMLRLDDQ